MKISFDGLESRQLFAAGAIDTSFSGDGSIDVRTSLRDWAASGGDSAADETGRAVIASIYRTHQTISLTRLNTDGSVDTTFGTNGIATIPTGFNTKANGPFHIAIDHAGKILVQFKDKLTRLNVAGGVDRKFGTKGTAAIPIMADIGDLTVDARNRPVIVGTSVGKTGARGTIIRLGERGALDLGFGGSGAYKTPVPRDRLTNEPGNAHGTAIEVLASGLIIGVASTATNRGYDENPYRGERGVSAFRLNADGTLDARYGTGGATALDQTYSEYTTAAAAFEAFYPDGGMIIGNSRDTYQGGSLDDYLEKSWTRIDANGRPSNAAFEGLIDNPERDDDTTITTPYYTVVAAIGADNKPILRSYDLKLLRYKSDFSLDDGFAAQQNSATIPGPSGRSVLIAGGRALIFTPIYGQDDLPVRSASKVTAFEL